MKKLFLLLLFASISAHAATYQVALPGGGTLIINGLPYSSPQITNSATVTWTTNAQGLLVAEALGTNVTLLFADGVAISNIVSSASVTNTIAAGASTLSIRDSGVSAGTYSNIVATIGADGRVTLAESATNLVLSTLSAGTLTATSVSGDGSGLTNLNGSNIASGTVAAARIDTAIARTNAPTLHSPTLLAPSLGVASATSLTLGATNVVTELAGKAPLSSPALTGTPTAPTASVGTSSTQIATTEFVSTENTDASSLAKIFLTDDLVSPSATIGEGGTVGTANGGTVGMQNSEAGRVGLRFVRSNTTNDAPHWGWSTASGAYPFLLTTSEYHFVEIIQKGPAATTDTDSYENRAGFLTALTGTNAVTDGAYLVYGTNLASGSNWGFVTVSNANFSTVANTGVAYNGSGAYARLGVYLSSSNAIAYIEGVPVATNTTHIPVGRRFGAASQQGRYWGTANLDTVIDRFWYKWEGTSR